MANRWAIKSGLWTDVATWNGGGSTPGTEDDCYAGGFSVQIAGNTKAKKLYTVANGAIPAGGGFWTTAAVTITANVQAGTTTCLHLQNGAVLVGNSQGGTAVGAIGALLQTRSIQYGNSLAGSAEAAIGTFIEQFSKQYGNSAGSAVSAAHGTQARYGGTQIGNSNAGSHASSQGSVLFEGGYQLGDALGGATAGTIATYSVNGGLFHGNAVAGSAAGATGLYVATGGIGIVEQATGLVAGRYGATAQGNGQTLVIKRENGAWAKNIGSFTDVTYDKIPFAVRPHPVEIADAIWTHVNRKLT